jgi:hypothetical protein
LANDKIEEAEGKINEEMAAQMEQEIENVKLQLADAKAELEKRDGVIATLEQDKVELAAASEVCPRYPTLRFEAVTPCGSCLRDALDTIVACDPL